MKKRYGYFEKIKPFIAKPIIKIITGIRRSGKTYLLKQIIEELKKECVEETEICFINKESLDFDFIKNYVDLNTYVKNFFTKQKSKKKYLFIDEIQDIEEWEKAVRSFASEENYDIYITGSNAKLLASELATYLSGRYVEFTVYPLSFKEFIDFQEGCENSIQENFDLYLRYGGFPALHLLPFEDDAIFQYLRAIYNTVVLKDIISRNQVRDVALLEQVIKFTMDNLGSILSANSIAKYLKSQNVKAGVDTILNYLSYSEASFLLNKCLRYEIQGNRYFESKEKIFLADHGLVNAILGFREVNLSGILENIIYIELLRRGYKVDIGQLGDKEVDFIATKAEKKIYIQVCYLLSSDETIERELNPLLSINNHYPKYIISMDQKLPAISTQGVNLINVVDFLLGSI
jgi:predicted AAA+ superfamily ATPase